MVNVCVSPHFLPPIWSDSNAHPRIHAIYTRRDHLVIHTFAAESIALFVLFMMWLVGTGIATVRPFLFMSLLCTYADAETFQSMWGNLGWCHQYSPCRLLSALVGIAWTGWVVLVFLLGSSLMHSLVNRAWTEPMHGHLYPRDSFVPAQMSEYRGSA